MKIQIFESQLKSLINSQKEIQEVDLDAISHFKECLRSRSTGFSSFEVEIWFKYKGTTNKTIVGEYPFDLDVQSKLDQLYKVLEMYTLPEDKQYVVVLHKFDIDYKKIDFYSESDRQKFILNFRQNQGMAYLKTPDGKKCPSSIGDTLVVIVRKNKAVTTFLHRRNEGMNIESFQKRESVKGIIDDIINVKDIDLYAVSKKSKLSSDRKSEMPRLSFNRDFKK